VDEAAERGEAVTTKRSLQRLGDSCYIAPEVPGNSSPALSGDGD
jgi:hypothetical protein